MLNIDRIEAMRQLISEAYNLAEDDLGALCALDEAVEILDEAYAAEQRKAINRNLKSIQSSDVALAYFAGSLTKEKARDFYDSVMSDLDKYKDAVAEIPPETRGEKFVNAIALKHLSDPTRQTENLVKTATGAGVGAGVGAGTALLSGNPIIGVGLGAAIILISNIFIRKGNVKTKEGEKNWNKAYAERALDAVIARVEKTYNKYYR